MHLSIHMMMAFYLPNLVLVSMLFLPLTYSSSHPVLCDAGERSALLQFKASFVIHKFASIDTSAYPRTRSWSVHSDCCSWDGVHCGNGHVIGLDLSSSCLFGSIHSNSTLFNLSQLQRLILADNHFNFSAIPPKIALFSTTLTHLNLSRASFAGQIPSEISLLSKLTVLDLSLNIDTSPSPSLLQLKQAVFTSFVQNMSNLEHLSLTLVDISSTVPTMLSNLSSLSALYMRGCNLVGEFPSTVFLLPKLEVISIRYNQQLTGHLPTFNHWSPLKFVIISNTGLSGPISSSLGHLTNLTDLDLSYNNFTVGDLSWLAHLNNLQSLDLSDINISTHIPHSLASLVNLESLSLESCHLTGQIPSWIQNLTRLTSLGLFDNFLRGRVRQSVFSKLVNLEALYLAANNLSGTLEFSMFQEMLNISILDLGGNHLSVADDYNGTLPNLTGLGLDSCSLQKLPSFLMHQQNLNWLYLNSSNMHGRIPNWFCNTSRETLRVLVLSNNFLTGLDQCSNALPWVNLRIFDLSHNLLRGSLPSPPPSIIYYSVKDNGLTGKLPSLFCKLSSLSYLELGYNNFSGELPRCLGSLSNLALLTVNNNNFHGTIPPMCANGINKVEALNFAENQLEGKLPTSLANCAMLRGLNVGQNKINDTFPFWMGKLDMLQLLILGSNKFHGPIESSASANKSEFSNLRIINLSQNLFSGLLPSALFYKWKAMKNSNLFHFTYMKINRNTSFADIDSAFSMILTNKGSELEYGKIPNELAAIDFSSNYFRGEIPESIGNLNGLYMLNLSNNYLTGPIAHSLTNLSVIESLDLSNNNLGGEIPQEMAQLNFLAFLNVSHNNLTGQVPRGQQFDTFQDSSFDGNVGLCGELLITKKCRGYAPPPQMAVCYDKCEDIESSFPEKSDWIVMIMGCCAGLVVGFVMGNELMARKPEWFIKVFGRNRKVQRRKGRN